MRKNRTRTSQNNHVPKDETNDRRASLSGVDAIHLPGVGARGEETAEASDRYTHSEHELVSANGGIATGLLSARGLRSRTDCRIVRHSRGAGGNRRRS